MALVEDGVAQWLCEVTGAREVVSSEPVQTLWSGYGTIARCGLAGASRGSVIVKRIQWPSTKEHPRGWATDRSHARKVRSYEVEAAWYRDHAVRCEVGVVSPSASPRRPQRMVPCLRLRTSTLPGIRAAVRV